MPVCQPCTGSFDRMAVKWARARRASRVRRSSSAPSHAGSAARTLTKVSRHVNQYGPPRQGERMQPIAADRIDHIRLTRQLTSPGERYPFFASVSRGEFVALFRGVYMRAPLGNAMSLDQRYRARVMAASLVGQWPTRVHALVPRAAGGRSTRMLERHTAVRRLGERSSSPTPWQIGRASR